MIKPKQKFDRVMWATIDSREIWPPEVDATESEARARAREYNDFSPRRYTVRKVRVTEVGR